MKRIARLILVFACLFTVFIILMPFLSSQFGPYPLMKVQDVADLFTPLVLIPVYWLLFEVAPERRPGRAEVTAFLIVAALWAEGQGMHLSSNSVDNLLQGKGPAQVVEAVNRLGAGLTESGVAALTYFYDEVLSHYLWHAAMMAFAALLIFRQWRSPFAPPLSSLALPMAAGVLYGLDHGLMALEGGTLPLAVPFAAGVVAFTLIWGRGELRRQPLLTFLFVAFAVALTLWLVWWLVWGCLAGPLDALHAVLQGTRPICP